MKSVFLILAVLTAFSASAADTKHFKNMLGGDTVCTTSAVAVVQAEASVRSAADNAIASAWLSWLGTNTYVKAEADPVAGPRLALLEGKADNWDASFGWGNHALAGYLGAATWINWLGTNTYVKTETDQAALAALAEYAATNNVTRWQDSANSNLWWEIRGSTQIVAMARLETPQLVIRTGTASFVGGAIPTALVPYLTAWTSSGYTGMFRYYSALGDPGVVIAQIDVEGEYGLNYEQAIWNGPVPEYGAVSEMPLIYTSGEMAATGTAVAEWVSEWPVATYNLTTGNVWQAVSALRTGIDDALLTAYGVQSQLNNHLAATDPHPGKYAPASATNAPAWLVYSNIASSVTVVNQAERPVRIYGQGSNTGLVSFAALREPLPLFFEASAFASLSFSNAYVVGGGYWQTNRVNMFIAFASGTNVFVTPITTREP